MFSVSNPHFFASTFCLVQWRPEMSFIKCEGFFMSTTREYHSAEVLVDSWILCVCSTWLELIAQMVEISLKRALIIVVLLLPLLIPLWCTALHGFYSFLFPSLSLWLCLGILLLHLSDFWNGWWRVVCCLATAVSMASWAELLHLLDNWEK